LNICGVAPFLQSILIRYTQPRTCLLVSNKYTVKAHVYNLPPAVTLI